MNVIYQDLLLNSNTSIDLKNNFTHINNKISYIDDDSIVTIEYYEDTIYLLRKGNIITDLEIKKNNKTTCIVYSEFGRMLMDCFCESIEINNKGILFRYRLEDNDQIVSHISVSVKF